MSYSPFVQSRSSPFKLHQELRHEDLPNGSEPSPCIANDAEAAQQGSLVTARGRGRIASLPGDKHSGVAHSELFSARHRKQDSISSDFRELPSCRSDDASGSSVSLESVGSGGPPSPMEKIGTQDVATYPSGSTTIHAHQTSTPLNVDLFDNNGGLFDMENISGETNGLDFMNTSAGETNQHILSPIFDFGELSGSSHSLKLSDDSLQGNFGQDGNGHNIVLSSYDPGAGVACEIAQGQASTMSPCDVASFTHDQEEMNTTNDKLLSELQFDPSFASDLQHFPALNPYNSLGSDAKSLEMGHVARIRGAAFEDPQQQEQRLQRQQQQRQENRQGHQHQSHFLQPQQYQQTHQQQLQIQQHQQRLDLQQPQSAYTDPKCRGLAINLPVLPMQDSQLPSDRFRPQQPLIPLSSTLHTQINPPLGHVKRFPEPEGEFFFHKDRSVLGHSRQGSISGNHQRNFDKFRSMPHSMLLNRRTSQLSSGDNGEYFHNSFREQGSGIESMPLFDGGEDTHQGFHGFHARSRSKSKLPLVDLFAMMGLAHNHPEGKRREQKVMDILKGEGFDLGHKTFIRDLDEPERRRIMEVVIQETRDWGYGKELLEIIVHRGVYARMQSQLRRRRRSDQRQKTRGAHRLPTSSIESRRDNDK